MRDWRAITVKEPLASCIVDGHKPVENRSSGFPRKYRGWLLIHTSAKWSGRGALDPRVLAAYPAGETYDRGGWLATLPASQLRRWGAWNGRPPEPYTGGAFIGAVHLDDAHHCAPGCCDSEWAEEEYTVGDRSVERDLVHLVVSKPRRFAPYPFPGRLGLWTPPRHVLEELPL